MMVEIFNKDDMCIIESTILVDSLYYKNFDFPSSIRIPDFIPIATIERLSMLLSLDDDQLVIKLTSLSSQRLINLLLLLDFLLYPRDKEIFEETIGALGSQVVLEYDYTTAAHMLHKHLDRHLLEPVFIKSETGLLLEYARMYPEDITGKLKNYVTTLRDELSRFKHLRDKGQSPWIDSSLPPQ